jgi:two-component system, cell cycle sensor histidine kinase and response regulator CckA
MQREKQELYIRQEHLRTENSALRKKIHELEQRAAVLDASNRTLDMVVKGTEVGYWDWNIKTGELTTNATWASLCGYSLDELQPITINTWTKLCHPDDIANSNKLLEEHFSGKTNIYEIEIRMRHKLGHWIWVLDRGKIFERDSEGNPIRMVGSHQDITTRKCSEQALVKSRAFEHLVTALANQFINLPFEHIDTMISDTLQLIGEFVDADRSYVFQFRDNLRLMDNTHEWCAEGVKPEINSLKGLLTSSFPWWMEHIRNNMIIHLHRIADIPAEALAEKKILEAQHIKSLIVIPLVAGSSPFGYIGFDAVKQEKEWQPETISILKLAGGIIANALQRKQVEHFIQAELDLAIKLNRSSSVLETLHTCLQAAILASGLDCGGIYLVNKLDETITLTIHEGLPPAFINHSALYHFNSENARLILKGKPIYHQFKELGLVSDKVNRSEQLKAIAILPITYRGEVVACLNIASHTLAQVPEFSRKGLETITSHIGSAIMQARQEEAIAEAKSNLESLFDTIDDLLFIIDTDGNVIHTNAAVRKKLGYSAKTISNKHVLHFHPEEQWDVAKNNIEGMLAGEQNSCLVPLQTDTGTLLPVETKITRGIWNNKPVLFGISRDFSERLMSEKTLRESEKRFRELTELLPLTLFETNIRGAITYANAKSLEVFGYTPDITKKRVFAINFCIPQDAEKALLHLDAIKKGLHITEEYTALRKDGSTFPAQVYSLPIIQNGQIRGIRGLVVDLTELKKAEQALRTSEVQKRIVQEFKALIDNIPGAVYQTNAEGKTTILSMISDILLDYTKEELEQELFATGRIIHPDDRNIVFASNEKLKSSKTSQALCYRIIMKNGNTKWLEDRKTSVFSPNGICTGIDGILFDVTERIIAQEEKQQLEANIRKTQRLETIGTLAGGIAHDFNNILTPILGYAEMGVLSLPEEEPMREYFNEIMRAAERAKNLVAQILTFSTVQESTPDIVSVQEIIREALKLLRPSIPSTITIEQDIDNSCRNILADPSQIHQVIINLCTNAFHAMEQSGGLLTITLKEIFVDANKQKQLPKLHTENYVKLSIADTGTGMDKNTIERIFEPFFTTKSVNKGTGLGLSVVHGIITSFHGEITVDSVAEKGTTFSVYLPIINEETVQGTITESCAKGYGSILFIEDEPTVLKMMTMMITKLGFKIQAMSSPLQALELFRKNPERFDLVITDLTMPEMTGIELARELHKTTPQLPVILMTGYEKDIEHSNHLSHYGISQFLKKPVTMTQMATTINEVIFRTNA